MEITYELSAQTKQKLSELSPGKLDDSLYDLYGKLSLKLNGHECFSTENNDADNEVDWTVLFIVDLVNTMSVIKEEKKAWFDIEETPHRLMIEESSPNTMRVTFVNNAHASHQETKEEELETLALFALVKKVGSKLAQEITTINPSLAQDEELRKIMNLLDSF